RILEWVARREPTHARVARLRATKARELAVQRLGVLRQKALPRVGALQPATYPVRQVPHDAIVVERDLPAIWKDAQRSELPRDTFGHTAVKASPNVRWYVLTRYGQQLDAIGGFAQADPGDIDGYRVHAHRVPRRWSKHTPRAEDGQAQRLPAVVADVADRPADANRRQRSDHPPDSDGSTSRRLRRIH